MCSGLGHPLTLEWIGVTAHFHGIYEERSELLKVLPGIENKLAYRKGYGLKQSRNWIRKRLGLYTRTKSHSQE